MKTFLQNRKGQKIVAVVDEVDNAKGLGFVMHGLSGYKEQRHLVALADALKENGYTTVLFDATNSFGESEGSYADATVTKHTEDLEDVIAWAKGQSWYKEPFVLVGHSMGALASILYAQKNPTEVKALVPVSTLVSGKLSFDTPKYKEEWKIMKERGWIEEKKGVKLKWDQMEDRLKYDVLEKAHLLMMPVLLMVGSLDEGTPIRHQQLLFDLLPGKKKMYVIVGSTHTPYEEKHCEEIKKVLFDWMGAYSLNILS